MLDLLNRITTHGESMTVTYHRVDDASVSLVIQPALAGDPEAITDDDARAARAALCRPLLFRGSHAEVEAAVTRYVADNADSRLGLRDAYDTLTADTKTAASKAVQAAADKKTRAAASKKNSDNKTAAAKAARTSAQTETPADATANESSAAQAAGNPTSVF